MPLFLLVLLASIFVPPKPSRYVTDRAFVLKDANALNAKLANFERQTSDQILVYVDQHLPPNTTIEEMGSEAMRRWGVGQKGKDNGAVLFVFIGDRKMRIEVGYGLEGSLTDAKSKWITSTVIKPQFQRGDYDSGVRQGVDAMLATIRGEPYRGNGRTVAQTAHGKIWPDDVPPGFLFGCFIVIGMAALVGYLISRGILRFQFSGNGSSGASDFGSSSGGGSSSSSSDSFSGGGASGGGGGASDSW